MGGKVGEKLGVEEGEIIIRTYDMRKECTFKTREKRKERRKKGERKEGRKIGKSTESMWRSQSFYLSVKIAVSICVH